MGRRPWAVAATLALAVAFSSACRDAPPVVAPTAPAVTGARPSDAAAEPASPERAADVDPAGSAILAPADPDATAAQADTVANAASSPDTAGPLEAPDTATFSVVDATAPDHVDQAMCDAACAHALALTEAELPAEVSAEVRSAMRDAMRDRCPQSCMEKGTLVSVQCVMKASTVLQISACSE